MYDGSERLLEIRNINITLTKVQEEKGREQGQFEIEKAAEG